MSLPKTSEKSVYLDREEHFHKGQVGGKIVVPYYYDSGSDTLTPATQPGEASTYKKLIDDTTTTNVTYIGEAPVGSASSAAVWRIKKVDESTSPTSITWAGVGFTATYDNRVSETYS